MINAIPEEADACQPLPLQIGAFNQNAKIPFGLEVSHIQAAMQEFLDFLGFVNLALHSKKIPRLESFLMPANFSSMVGEFMKGAFPVCQHSSSDRRGCV
ncbi:MAG: hypothetical protein HQL83_16570, partial [Magnetococcales bacterium]|nr:hypothetical protein [Magnetococcales bacterium]